MKDKRVGSKIKVKVERIGSNKRVGSKIKVKVETVWFKDKSEGWKSRFKDKRVDLKIKE